MTTDPASSDPELASISSEMQRLLEKLQSPPTSAADTLVQFEIHRSGGEGSADQKSAQAGAEAARAKGRLTHR